MKKGSEEDIIFLEGIVQAQNRGERVNWFLFLDHLRGHNRYTGEEIEAFHTKGEVTIN